LFTNFTSLNSFLDLYLSPERTRFRTREVLLGDLGLGANHPVRIQSMTNTDTNDTESTLRQCIALADAGCEIIRITAQGEREARNLAVIRKQLHGKGYYQPLVADIHFNPAAALIAAEIVEKVRINPGNYINKQHVLKQEFTPREYALELEYIAEQIAPLLEVCKRNGTAIRIGSNHGSLSRRIIGRYGDTPAGMVESALEFARICKDADFHQLVISMKSSNVRVMVQATRLLVHRMMAEGMDYPIHLGVTEAGDGEDGIVKSAAGIGALLEDGIGDTLRVSLTGDPLKEIPVALEIAKRYQVPGQEHPVAPLKTDILPDPFSYHKYSSLTAGRIGGNNPVQVIASIDGKPFLAGESGDPDSPLYPEELENLLVLDDQPKRMRLKALDRENNSPVLIRRAYTNPGQLAFLVNAAIDAGSLLIDGFGEALQLEAPGLDPATVNRTAFSILQATRTRITRTEFISCPSCGRTLFDIETTLSQVKEATGHLKGLRIAVMGCIVNGPGEMADAHYGYVGAGKGKITLYKGKEVMQRGIPEQEAIGALIRLIRDSGDWVEK